MSFQLQIASEYIRDRTFDSVSLYVYMKLVQRYYLYKKKYTTFEIDHKLFMTYAGIKSNKKFKEALDDLYERKLIKNKIDALPRRGLLTIEINNSFDKKKDYKFTQLPIEVMDKSILDEIGHCGVRLLFYFKSYINNEQDFCFCSTQRIEDEIDMSENTIIKHTDKLHKLKYIKKVKHKLEKDGDETTIDEFGNERQKFIKYNNHYYIRYKKLTPNTQT